MSTACLVILYSFMLVGYQCTRTFIRKITRQPRAEMRAAGCRNAEISALFDDKSGTERGANAARDTLRL